MTRMHPRRGAGPAHASAAGAAGGDAANAGRAGGRVAGWLQALAVYREPRLLFVLVLGFSSGLPLLLTLSTLSYWLATLGVDKTTIGLFALVGLPYTLKFIWAPLLDHVVVPGLGRWLGRRRAWALVTQVGLIGAILSLGLSDPATAPLATAACALAIAFFSASQDIVIDAYRIEILREDEQGAGAAAIQLGYRVGILVAGAGALALSDFVAWPAVFAALAALVLIGVAAVLLAPMTPADRERLQRPPAPATADRLQAARDWLQEAVIAPFADFLRHPGWVAIIAFVLLYKFGDAIGGVMANPFYVELGFTGVEIGSISKVLGFWATVFGTVAGGAVVYRLGIFRALLVGGILQAVTNLLFAAQALVGHDIAFLALSICSDNFTGGLGAAAFVAYLSSLCNARFTGTQYALLTSLMAAGRTVLSSGGGWLADQLDWVTFFVATTALAIPGLLLLLWLMRRQPAVASPDAGRAG